MSTMRESIMLAAPDRAGTEHYFSRPQTCRYCGGSGHFAPYGPDDKASICPDCNGTGKMVAVVDITWVPARRRDQPRKTGAVR
ncbi:hypothetical protein [Paramuribaculum intestinale]|jgi:hypothetical protein|uniref:hypothetical protein n=1 Tax=Paramuribaculum intestinale TaxID=2094151 RepID=UPI0025B0F200|nr:hypothetical protein [Paramuribaculum intestinale]